MLDFRPLLKEMGEIHAGSKFLACGSSRTWQLNRGTSKTKVRKHFSSRLCQLTISSLQKVQRPLPFLGPSVWGDSFLLTSTQTRVGHSLRFKLGSIKGPKKSGFSPYATPPKRLRIFEFLVRDQEVGGSNPLAPGTLDFPPLRKLPQQNL
jgi:hypothetical protein